MSDIDTLGLMAIALSLIPIIGVVLLSLATLGNSVISYQLSVISYQLVISGQYFPLK